MQPFASALSPEDRVLLCSARLTLDEGSCQTLATLLRTKLDWEKLLNRSIAQGVTPLLHKHLRHKPEWWRGIPQFACDRLEKLYHHNVQRNGELQQELEAVLAILQEADIPVMLMKELHLLQAIYADPGLRPLGDLDLLVRREDFEAAKNLLGQAGYRPALRRNPHKERYGFGYHLINPEKGIWIDLQWNLCQREWSSEAGRSGKFRPPIQQIWQRATAGLLLESRVWRKSWEDLLFHLCVHAEGHWFGELIQLCDIAAVIQRCGRELDWPYLIETAQTTSTEASLYCPLRLVHEIWGVTIPEEVFKQLRPAYLPFEIYNATFGALVMLYTFLDEAANDTAVSRLGGTLQHWERITRDTVEQNHRVYEAMDGVMDRLSHVGLAPIVFTSQEPERTLPHARLRPLGEMAILVAPNDRLEPVDKKLEAQLNAIGDESIQFKLRQEPDRLEQILSLPSVKATSFRQQLKKIFLPNRPRRNTISIYPLAPEEILLILCQRFGRTSSWLDFCVLTEFLRGVLYQINWPVLWDKAQEHQLANVAAASLLCICELTPITIPAVALAPVDVLAKRLPVSLCAIPAAEILLPPKRGFGPELQNAVQAAIRFLVLPSQQERRQYLANLAQQSYPESGAIRRRLKLCFTAIKLFSQWLGVKKNSHRQPMVAPHVFWLETPQVDAADLAPALSRQKNFQTVFMAK